MLFKLFVAECSEKLVWLVTNGRAIVSLSYRGRDFTPSMDFLTLPWSRSTNPSVRVASWVSLVQPLELSKDDARRMRCDFKFSVNRPPCTPPQKMEGQHNDLLETGRNAGNPIYQCGLSGTGKFGDDLCVAENPAREDFLGPWTK